MTTYFQGAITSGTTPSEYTNVGYAVFSQSTLINHVVEAGGGNDNVDATIVLPANCQILNIFVDTLVAWNSGTSAGLTIGTSAGGTQILSSSDVKTDGRETTAPTAAQLAVWDDIDTSTTMYIRVAQSGNTSAGQARVTIVYSPKE